MSPEVDRFAAARAHRLRHQVAHHVAGDRGGHHQRRRWRGSWPSDSGDAASKLRLPDSTEVTTRSPSLDRAGDVGDRARALPMQVWCNRSRRARSRAWRGRGARRPAEVLGDHLRARRELVLTHGFHGEAAGAGSRHQAGGQHDRGLPRCWCIEVMAAIRPRRGSGPERAAVGRSQRSCEPGRPAVGPRPEPAANRPNRHGAWRLVGWSTRALGAGESGRAGRGPAPSTGPGRVCSGAGARRVGHRCAGVAP